MVRPATSRPVTSRPVTFRPVAPDDFEAALELLIADEEHSTGGRSRLGISDLRVWLSGLDYDEDTWLVEEDGRIVALGWHEPEGEVSFAAGAVHPDVRGRGLGAELVARGVARARAAGAARLHYGTIARDKGAPELLTAHGFREVRRFYRMAIEVDGPPSVPSLPAGLAIETFREDEAEAFHHALDDAFQDHWEHHPQPWQEWWKRHRDTPGYDPTLWFVVRDGDEIAAIARNDANRNDGGWVGALGVRRPWRGRGLGKALLLHTFAELHRRGITRVSLGVDAENPTGATRLYQGVGMTVEMEHVIYEKSLA
jgi:mycothiol synthase